MLKLLVRAIRWEAEGIHSFELTDPQGAPLPPVTAGAHLDVHLPSLPVPGLVRSYSLAGDPADRSHWVLGVLREAQGSGGSRAMHEQVRVGELLNVSAPRNAFALQPNAKHSILIAGGIGITPLKAMAHTLQAQGASFELHVCARSPRRAAFADALRALVPAAQLHFHFDQGDPTQGLDIKALLDEVKPDAHVYYCGPAGLMLACAKATEHWPRAQVHCEHFKAPEPVAKPLADDGVDRAFDVVLARQCITVRVEPDQSIVRALELQGFRVPTSCLSGLCGACKTDVLEGEIDHRDYILRDDERTRCMTLCVSRAKGDSLVVDL